MKDAIHEAVEEGKRESKPTLVDLTAPWCTTCVVQDSIIERVRGILKDTVVVKIDLEEHPQVAESYDILSLPSILIFDPDGRLGWRSSGRIVETEEIVKAVSLQRKPS